MPSIAIIGAGPAGLTLARLLLVKVRNEGLKDLQIDIFEHDANANSRYEQGGTLDLHPSTGIAALKAAEMWDDILPRMRYEGEELFMADMNATTFIHLKSAIKLDSQASTDDRPEVDREVLKQYLLKATEDMGGKDIIHWGKHLQTVDPDTGILTFKDGSQAGPFDLVVGGDGAWSKVRNAVTDVKPTYAGICGFESWVDEEHSGDKWKQFTDFCGEGSFFSFSGTSAVMAQRMENGSMKAACWLTKEQTWPADVIARCGGDEDKIRETLMNEFSQWDTQITDLIRKSYRYRPWPLYELPIGHQWEHKKGFTLIGDAAHLMTPFAGEGVNAAMKDSLELADAIAVAVKGENTLDEAIQRFEQDSFVRNKRVQEKTAHNKTLMFREDSPIGFFATVPKMFADEMGYDTSKLWMKAVLFPLQKLAYMFFWSKSWYGYFSRCIRKT